MIKVVICGSYHTDSEGLKRIFRELESHGCRILSPISLDFTSTSEAVVKTAHEDELSIDELEKFHLRALRDADIVWLHTPSGHVGVSGSFELGFATALNIPVFSTEGPRDEMLQTRVTVVDSVFSALDQL